MHTYSTLLLRIGDIAGMYYHHEVPVDTLIIYGIGAPIPPDCGLLPDAEIIDNFQVDIFVPDYIGYGRSDGVFTPQGCIDTFLNLFEAFSQGCNGFNSYNNTSVALKYKRIIFIGRSLGGTYVPLLPRFNPKITELAIFCPVVDSKSCGSVTGEESNEDFLRSMKEDGYHHLYRGILDPVWAAHLENKDDLSPMDNIAHLKNAKLFIGHGKQDTCVNYSKSVSYYEKIRTQFPNSNVQFMLKLYKNGGHGATTTHPATHDFFKWINVLSR